MDNETHIDNCWNRIGVWSQTGQRCQELDRVVHCHNCTVYAQAGRMLLDRIPTEENEAEWTNALANAPIKTEKKTSSVFVFRTGIEWFALPASIIQEVLDIDVIHSIPHLNNTALRGIVNVRGKLELCFSIGLILGIERFAQHHDQEKRYISSARLIVVAKDGQRFVFPATEVMGIIKHSSDMLRSLPATVSKARAVYTKGIICFAGKDIGLLSDESLFQSLNRSLS